MMGMYTSALGSLRVVPAECSSWFMILKESMSKYNNALLLQQAVLEFVPTAYCNVLG